MIKMIALLSTCLLWTTPALAQYAEATVHERSLFKEGAGSMIFESICNPSWDRVQFRFCSSQVNCNLISPEILHYSELDQYQEPLLRALSEYRKNLVVKSRYHSTLLWGPNKNDVLALDQVTDEIKSEGLKKWLLLKSDRRISPDFSTYEAADEVSSVMAAVFSQPLKTPPVKPTIKGDEMANLPSDGTIR